MTKSKRVAKMHMTKEDWTILRIDDWEYHLYRCKANNLPPMHWAKYKIYFDSRNTAEENHQRIEEILSQPTFADNLSGIHDELYYLNAQVQRNK